MRSNALSASGSYASYSRYRTLRARLWLRTRPRNVTTAPSAPASAPILAASTAAIRSSSSGSRPIARSEVVTVSVYEVRLKQDTTEDGAVFQPVHECPAFTHSLAGPVLPEVIDRSAAVADPEGMRDRAGDVLLGAGDGIRQLTTERQTGGHGGRKRAPGPVRGPCIDPSRAEFVEHMTIKEQIDDLRPRALSPRPCVAVPHGVPAGDDHGRRAHVVNPSRGLARLLGR